MKQWFANRCLVEATFPQVQNAFRLPVGEFYSRMMHAARLRGAKIEDDEIPPYTGFVVKQCLH